MRLLTIAVVLLIATSFGFAAEDYLSKYAQWITGDVFIKDDLMLFRADKPVQDNKTGDVVLIGTRGDAEYKYMDVVLEKAVNSKVRLRLYGVLMPAMQLPGPHKNLPSVQFIVWKSHLPTDPDDPPPGAAIHIDANAKTRAYKVVIPK